MIQVLTAYFCSSCTTVGKSDVVYDSIFVNSRLKKVTGRENGRLALIVEIDTLSNIEHQTLLYKNGRVYMDCHIKNNAFHGLYISYYSNGKVKEKSEYEMGRRVNESIIYDKNGKTTEYKLFSPKGQLLTSYKLKNGYLPDVSEHSFVVEMDTSRIDSCVLYFFVPNIPDIEKNELVVNFNSELFILMVDNARFHKSFAIQETDNVSVCVKQVISNTRPKFYSEANYCHSKIQAK